MLLDHTLDDLLELPRKDLVKLTLTFQDQLRKAHIKLALSRVTIADHVATIKQSSAALRRMNRQRKSLKNTVKRRRKNTR